MGYHNWTTVLTTGRLNRAFQWGLDVASGYLSEVMLLLTKNHITSDIPGSYGQV